MSDDVCGKPGCAGGHLPGNCTGHRSDGSGRACRNRPVRGGKVCSTHGGSAGQVKAIAAGNLLELQARKLLPAEFREHPDPLGEALRTLSEAVAFRDAIRGLVSDMTSLRYSTEGGEQLRAEVAVYERALDRVAKICEGLIRLDIEARRTAVLTAQATVLATALRQVIVAVGADPASDAAVRAVQAVMSDLAAA